MFSAPKEAAVEMHVERATPLPKKGKAAIYRWGLAAVVAVAILGITAMFVGVDVLIGTLSAYSHVYLPTADVSANLVVLIGLGFGVGCLSGLFGVGVGFLMTPLLMMVGIPPASAVASDSCQIVGASCSGALAHRRMGNVDAKLGITLVLGGLVGGTAGVQIVAALRALGSFDCWVKVTYVIVLGTVGTLMVRESAGLLVKNWVYGIRQQLIQELVKEGYVELRSRLDGPKEVSRRPFGRFMDGLPFQTSFARAGMRASYLFPFALGILVGLLTAIMGVGGGFIMVPAMIYILGVDTRIAVGTSLFQMVFTSVNVTFQQAVTNQTVDAVLALLLLVGSAAGAQVGAKLGRPLKGHQLRILLGLLVLAVTIKLILELVLPPGSCIALADSIGGH